MKKRWICLLLILVFLLSACGSGKTAEPAKADEGSAEISTAAPEPTEEASDEASEDIWKDGLMTLGVVEGDTYRNETMGFGVSLPGWVFGTSEDIAAQNEWGKDTMDEDLQQKIAESDSYIDMMAESEDGLANINVNVVNMKKVYSLLIDEEEYIEAALPEMPAQLEGIGCTNVKAEATTMKLDGEEHAAMTTYSELDGVPIYQKLVTVQVSGYLFAITATSFGEDTTDDIFAQFFKLS